MSIEFQSLALAVKQHDDGHFFWVVMESFAEPVEFESLLESAAGFDSYIEALDAGYLVLRKLVVDPSTAW
ncbi:hypothetical protein [Variovorax saccharolyticus]|uniref:hypothetical protein n=1 Tax=Variovorax saccharolyticus TaxID=3053516 RepID=UPI00257784E1|nr:hypothetical protein [Variovorax sp. J22R187]MDM0019017.1 hypothetical protein [Variovorax sp. J22R187]